MADRLDLPDPERGQLVSVRVLGAARAVTGSMFLVETPRVRLLVECGMFQGGHEERARNREPFDFDPGDLDAVVLTHAHIDHSGRLPLLVREGYRGRIHCTAPTADLLGIMLRDSAHIQVSDAERRNRRRAERGEPIVPPLYEMEDAERALEALEPEPFGAPVELAEGVELIFRGAGHILGAASVELRVTHAGHTRSVLFSGDLGRDGMPLIPAPEPAPGADLVFLESTYGGRHHPTREDSLEKLHSILRFAEREHGNILIPVFAVGRAQAVLALLAELERDEGRSLGRVYLDTPMGINVTELYRKHKQHLRPGALEEWGDRLPLPEHMTFTREADASRKLNDERNGIILSASGMLDAGRIQHHLKHNLWRPETQLVIVGFQAKGSLGRRLIEGAKQVKLFGKPIDVKAQVHALNGFSAHGDEDDLMGWISAFERPPEQLCLIHGEYEGQQAFAGRIERELGWPVRIPGPGERVRLDRVD